MSLFAMLTGEFADMDPAAHTGFYQILINLPSDIDILHYI